MKAPIVGSIGRSEKPRPGVSRGGTHRATFAALLGAAGLDAPTGPAAGAGPTSISGLLALQDCNETPAPRLARQRAETLLERLDRLHADLLDSRVSGPQLQQMAEALRQPRPESGDRRLDDIIAAIELRVEVELAKWTRESHSGLAS